MEEKTDHPIMTVKEVKDKLWKIGHNWDPRSEDFHTLVYAMAYLEGYEHMQEWMVGNG